MVRNVQNFELFDQKKKKKFSKTIFVKVLMLFCKKFVQPKQLFNGILLIFRLLSFSVPKIRPIKKKKTCFSAIFF